jgi:hypothetical protein
MVYGSQTWVTKVDDVRRLERADRAMVRWFCGVKFKIGDAAKNCWTDWMSRMLMLLGLVDYDGLVTLNASRMGLGADV